jgi:multiple sugar transport system permease protein
MTAAVLRPGRRRLSEPGFAVLLNAPAVLLILALVAYPLVLSFIGSMQHHQLRLNAMPRFVGLDNFVYLLGQQAFWNALGVTVSFTAASVALTVAAAVPIALVLNEPFPGRGLVRALVLIPWAVPPVVNGLLWQWILNGKVGALNGALYQLGLIDEYISWVANPNPAVVMATLVFAHVWKTMPFAVIVLLAALQSIPGDLYDAARVDRAGAWQRFRHVTLPWLVHPLIVVLILETLSAFQAFDIIYVLTGGGPGTATTTLSWLAYTTAFEYRNLGQGNAIAYVMALLQLCLALVYLFTLRARGDVRQ